MRSQTGNSGRSWQRTVELCLLATMAILWLSTIAVAETVDAQQAEATARKKYIDRFYKFTLDKNVMGKAQSPDGKKSGGGKKVRFDNDDAVAYESDLTYHDLSYNTEEELPNKGQGGGGGGGQGGQNGQQQKPPETRKLFAFVSPHGKLTSAGGSSLLERTVYQEHNKFSEQEKKEAEQAAQKGTQLDDDKPGVKLKSVYKVETKEVLNSGQGQGGQGQGQGQGGAQGGAQGGQGQGQAKQEKDKVERVTLRDEVKQKVQQVGDQSFDTIKRSARDEDKQNDEKALPNLTFMYEAAGRAVKAMWNSAVANLGQRRANRAIPDTGLGKPELSEHFATCDSWAAASLQQQLQQVKDDKLKEALQKQLDQINQQCKQVTSLPYNTINPRFEADKDGKEKLKTGDLKSEDSIERDLRNQLEVMDKAGKKVTDLKSNWQYGADDEKVTRTRYDEGGQAQGEYTETVRDQLDKYNQQLQQAADGYDAVKARYPDLKYNKQAILNYQIQPESKSILEIDKPTASQMEELGAQPEEQTEPKVYNQVINEAQKLNQ